MSARRIARELAVILLPQMPKDNSKLSKMDLDNMVQRAVQMLTDYAKHALADANSFVLKAQQLLVEAEIDHPDNAHEVEPQPVKVTTAELREQLELMERALHLASEALDIPSMSLQQRDTHFLYALVTTYLDHKTDIDRFISHAKAKWRVERMVSIDRDILRLACAEAFYMNDVPINVAVSEAVELSHRFADEKAAKFINGVLSDLAQEAHVFRATGKLRDDATRSGDEGSEFSKTTA